MSGPVQVLVVGFEEPSFTGEVMAELTRLRAAGVVRLVDVLLVSREPDGTFETLPPPPGFDPALGQLATELLAERDGDIDSDGDSDGDSDEPGIDATWSLADAVEPGSLAAVALIEHLWAGPLVEAIRDAGGHTLAEAWLTPEDRAGLPD